MSGTDETRKDGGVFPSNMFDTYELVGDQRIVSLAEKLEGMARRVSEDVKLWSTTKDSGDKHMAIQNLSDMINIAELIKSML